MLTSESKAEPRRAGKCENTAMKRWDGTISLILFLLQNDVSEGTSEKKKKKKRGGRDRGAILPVAKKPTGVLEQK